MEDQRFWAIFEKKVADELMLEKLFPRATKLGIPNDPFLLTEGFDFEASA